MARLKNARTGVVVSVRDEKVAAMRGVDWSDADEGEPAAEGYAARTVADLRAEIERRNEGRDEAGLLSAEGRKADLVAALQADDTK